MPMELALVVSPLYISHLTTTISVRNLSVEGGPRTTDCDAHAAPTRAARFRCTYSDALCPEFQPTGGNRCEIHRGNRPAERLAGVDKRLKRRGARMS